MKKVLILTNHSFMLYRFRKELIEAFLKESKVVLSMPCTEHTDDFKAMGCEIIDTPIDRRGINPKTDLNLLKTYFKILKEQKPDMVVTYSIKPNIYGGYACRKLKIPYCVNVQGLGTAFQKKGLAQIVSFMYKTALKDAKKVFFENEGNAAVFRDRKLAKQQQITVLNGAGVNLERYKVCQYSKNEPMRFLYLGRLMKEKGMDELFYAAQKLHEKYGNKVIFDLVGFFEDAYKEKVEELSKKNIVVFHGFKKDPRPYYETADCVVLPSYHEGMSNVLLEAAAMAKPIITSDIPGCREAVIDGKSGLLCKAMDKDSLFDCLDKFVEMTYEQRRNMGLCGREHMEKEFDRRKIVEFTINTIKATLK